MITRDTLKKMSVSRLKDFCRHNKIKKFSQKKKQELIELILGQEDLTKFTNPKIPNLNCKIPMKTCKSTIYKKKAIQDLAKKCNIPITRNGKKLTRRQLCELITASLLNDKQTTIQPKKKKKKKKKTSLTRSLTRQTCFNGIFKDELKKKKVSELKSMLKTAGIQKGIPTKKSHLIEYLCSLGDDSLRCDPDQEILCSDGFICDVSNKPGVCLPDALADELKLEKIEYSGRTIIGTKRALKLFKKKIKKAKEQYLDGDEIEEVGVDVDVDVAGKVDEEIEAVERRGSAAEEVGVDVDVDEDVARKVDEDEADVDGAGKVDKIETILKKISNDEFVEIDNLDEIEKSVLKCLGLLASK